MMGTVGLVAGIALDAVMLFLVSSYLISVLTALLPSEWGHIDDQEREARRRLLLPPVGAFILVALGVGSVLWTAYRQGPDHCGASEVHPAHLCWLHPAGTDSSLSNPEVAFLGGLGLAVIWLCWNLFVHFRAQRQLASLEAMSRREEETRFADRLGQMGLPWPGSIRVLPSELPLCFVFGSLDPRLVVSTGLLADLSEADLRVVITHELAHVSRRDIQWRLICQIAALCHLPGLGLRAFRRWTFVVEAACDEVAASRLASRLAIAETLVRFQRLLNRRAAGSSSWAAGGLAFGGQGALEGRVKRLLESEGQASPAWLGYWPWAALAVAVWQTESIHTGLELILKFLHG